jgi:hypothetical protein
MLLDTGIKIPKLSYATTQSPKSSGEMLTCKCIDDFIGHLFACRNVVHLLHLNTKSYAAHVALNELYSGMLDIIDTLAETAQTDKLLSITIPAHKITGDALSYVQYTLEFVRSNRFLFPHTFQQNELDNLELLLSKTTYLLRFLN